MNDDNVGFSSDEYELAGLGQRLGASLIDTAINLVVAVPLVLFFLSEYIYSNEGIPFLYIMASTAVGTAFFLLVHGYFLNENGQTLGKKMVGIRIADLYNDVPSLKTLIFIRYMPFWLVTMIPVFGGFVAMVDILFIFREDRRCIHDHLAGTRVIVAR